MVGEDSGGVPSTSLRGRDQHPGGPVLVIGRARITHIGFPLNYLIQSVVS